MAVGVCSGIFFFFASFIRQIRTEHLLWTGDHASSWGISCKYHEICLRQLLSLKVPVWILSSILTSSKLLSHHIQNKLAPISQSIKMVERNINNLRYADDTTLMAESEEELKRQMYYLIVLEVRSPKMGQQGCTAFQGSLREYVSLPFSGSRGLTLLCSLPCSCQRLLIYLFGCNTSLLQHV